MVDRMQESTAVRILLDMVLNCESVVFKAFKTIPRTLHSHPGRRWLPPKRNSRNGLKSSFNRSNRQLLSFGEGCQNVNRAMDLNTQLIGRTGSWVESVDLLLFSDGTRVRQSNVKSLIIIIKSIGRLS